MLMLMLVLIFGRKRSAYMGSEHTITAGETGLDLLNWAREDPKASRGGELPEMISQGAAVIMRLNGGAGGARNYSA
jgi:hypothetical protein